MEKILVILITLLLYCSANANTKYIASSDNFYFKNNLSGKQKRLLSEPYIEFTSIPNYGNTGLLVGKVHNVVNFSNYKIAAYILLEGYGFYTKPTFQNPTVNIKDSIFYCNINTFQNDRFASCIVAFLIPNGTNPPLLNGTPEIPEYMFTSYVNFYTLRYRRKINFGEHIWWVKNTLNTAGPGPNYFSDDPQNVWVSNGQLHLKIKQRSGHWYCPEVICDKVFDYGKYVFKVSSAVGNFDRNVVFGLYTWDMAAGSGHREIDIEFIQSCAPHNLNSQYVIQPYNVPGHLHPFTFQSGVFNTSHIFEWKQDTVRFKSIKGFNINSKNDTVYQSWVFSGDDIPQHNKENVRINLWLCNANPPNNMQEAEVVIYDFSFIDTLGTTITSPEIPGDFSLYQNYPNPFNPITTIRFSIPQQGVSFFTETHYVLLKVYDLLGREIATPVNGRFTPGIHEIKFNSSNLASGVYFYTLKVENFFDTKRMVIVK